MGYGGLVGPSFKELRQRQSATVQSVELDFRTLQPKPGRKRNRHVFMGGWVEAHPLLGVAQQASVQHDAPPEGRGVVTSESSSGVEHGYLKRRRDRVYS